PSITSETLDVLGDYTGYQRNFLTLFGFGLDGVDYDEDVEIDLPLPSSL
ncbi:MAG TPA: bifunctional NADH-specific enoyl-ACP reductase/trans-2-enoyl-CoA reductase, partial [Opitutae bacterium]|nr:bifunctional NADH-specific enoyl-ACP reductase/trans-2-enoyl-CoA reductase [Opitutae bacterium]